MVKSRLDFSVGFSVSEIKAEEKALAVAVLFLFALIGGVATAAGAVCPQNPLGRAHSL